MPAVAVGAAIWGATTIATVGVAAMSTWAVIGSVGAITAGVGAVTGNKDLMKIGAVMGIVGGVGALATSSGAMGSTAAAEGTAAGADAVGGAAETATATAGTEAQAAMQSVVPSATPDAAAVAATPQPTVVAPGADAVGGAAEAAATASAAATPPPTGIVNAAAPPPPPAADASVFGAIKDFVKPMGEFAQKNQLLSYGVLQVGGSFMQGLFAQPTELETAQTDLVKRRAQNMAAPIPVATAAARRSVYNPGPRPVYQGPGLLNSVTGAPK
jgi:hypothetical protein